MALKAGRHVRDEGDWRFIDDPRDSAAYEELFDRETDQLAEAALDAMASLAQSPSRYDAMREQAWLTSKTLFSADDAAAFWDDFYEKSVRVKSENAPKRGFPFPAFLFDAPSRGCPSP